MRLLDFSIIHHTFHYTIIATMKKMDTLLRILPLLLALWQPFVLTAQSEQYLHLDRVDDYVETPNASALIANSTGFSMTGWFWTDQYAYGQGMMGIRGTNAGFYMIQLDNGKIECRFVNSAGTLYEYVAPTYTIVPEKWQHFAWVYDGTKIYLYLNGVLKGSKAATGKITATNVSFAIGKSLLAGFNFVYGGRVDEVTLWKKGLTQAEVQNMMANELTGSEQNLVLYYKCNQGLPGGDNTSISKLKCELGNGTLDGNLLNFAMNGPTSNFNGTLNTGFQAITFPKIPNKLTTSPAFDLNASASSGLPVQYEILSGPATLSGSTVTLQGQAGKVVVRATQPGNATYQPADTLESSFHVLDPMTHVPDVDARSPLVGDVFVPSLSPIHLATIASITYPELFSVQNVIFEVDGTTLTPSDWGNTHYTAWWTPPSYGAHTLKIIAKNNYGAAAVKTVNFNVVAQAANINDVVAVDKIWTNTDISVVEMEAELPSYLGAFSKITATLEVKCPAGGCGPWDRVTRLYAKGHEGKWFEIIRYITPYGVPCSHNIDLTDFMSILQGKIRFRVDGPTLDNGFVYTLKLNYQAGTPVHKYSSITALWNKNYPFGDLANLQPCEVLNIQYPANAVASKLKLVSTGHSWGDNNTGNAAEFHEDTHHIWVNGASTFDQHNWQICNPNPDGCQPQNGTYYYSRSGWCPGSIAQWFDYDMSAFVNPGKVEMKYIFDENYKDLCHPSNPNCVTGVTCANCADTDNPKLFVATNLITFADGPVGGAVVSGTDDVLYQPELSFSVQPNPSDGLFNLILKEECQYMDIRVVNSFGQTVVTLHQNQVASGPFSIQMQQQPKGVYLVIVNTERGAGVKKVVIR